MLIHQLFKNIPDVIFINRLAAAFGLKDINDYSTDISILSMENAQTVKRINDMNYEIGNYYIQCKRDKYVGDWTPKKCITMFRQFLKIFNYSLVYKERFINGKKYNIYRVINNVLHSKIDVFTINANLKHKYIITFD
jgi:hypothetical protein